MHQREESKAGERFPNDKINAINHDASADSSPCARNLSSPATPLKSPTRPSIKVRKSQLIADSLERLIKIKMRNLTFSRECTVICTRRRCHSSVQAKCKAVTRSIILTTLCRVCQDISNVFAFLRNCAYENVNDIPIAARYKPRAMIRFKIPMSSTKDSG